MFDCFKRKVKRLRAQEPLKPILTIGPEDNIPIALVIGHNERSQGAVNYLSESEYIFNKRIASKIQEKLTVNGIKTVVIERPVDSYSNQCKFVSRICKKLEVSFSLHLHFNSGPSGSRGCEVLVPTVSSKLGYDAADYITDLLVTNYSIIERHGNGIKTVSKGHCGYRMLSEVRDTGTIPMIIEPCFANRRSQESLQIFEQEDSYVDLLVMALYAIARGEIPCVK